MIRRLTGPMQSFTILVYQATTAAIVIGGIDYALYILCAEKDCEQDAE